MFEDKDEWDSQTRASTKGYTHTLQSFDFNFLLKVFFICVPKIRLFLQCLAEKSLTLVSANKK
jgi:hypothetical protein